MPVPIDDYVSGRWLEPDYVPAIPLPPPYDALGWTCGRSVPIVPEERRGGEPLVPLKHTGSGFPGAGVSVGGALLKTIEVGIPAPGGILFRVSIETDISVERRTLQGLIDKWLGIRKELNKVTADMRRLEAEIARLQSILAAREANAAHQKDIGQWSTRQEGDYRTQRRETQKAIESIRAQLPDLKRQQAELMRKDIAAFREIKKYASAGGDRPAMKIDKTLLGAATSYSPPPKEVCLVPPSGYTGVSLDYSSGTADILEVSMTGTFMEQKRTDGGKPTETPMSVTRVYKADSGAYFIADIVLRPRGEGSYAPLVVEQWYGFGRGPKPSPDFKATQGGHGGMFGSRQVPEHPFPIARGMTPNEVERLKDTPMFDADRSLKYYYNGVRVE